MIEEALESLKELFPYAILFNPKLEEIQVVDQSNKEKKMKDFTIKRIGQEKYGQIVNILKV